MTSPFRPDMATDVQFIATSNLVRLARAGQVLYPGMRLTLVLDERLPPADWSLPVSEGIIARAVLDAIIVPGPES